MNWAEVSIQTTTEGIEIVNGFLTAHGVPCVMIEDAADFNSFLEGTTPHWDYVDEELMALSHCDTKIKFYLPDNPQGFETLNQIKADLPYLPEKTELNLGELSVSIAFKEEEDWETAWKKYYHPIEISDRLVVVPEWEDFKAKPGQKVLRLNPGMAFGTGSHNTTHLCLSLLDKKTPEGLEVLDMGCGSGILSIASLLLGAKHVTAVDIDLLATKIARENAGLNGISGEDLTIHWGNVLEDAALADTIGEKSYDLIVANIVADVIMAMTPLFKRFLKPGGTLVVSGIISERADEVCDRLKAGGFNETLRQDDNDWTAAVFTPSGR